MTNKSVTINISELEAMAVCAALCHMVEMFDAEAAKDTVKSCKDAACASSLYYQKLLAEIEQQF